VVAVWVVPGIGFGARLLTDPAGAPWMNDPEFITDRFQYVESNYAGYGLAEIVAYVRARAAETPVVVLSRNVTGMPRDGVTAYLLAWPNVEVGFVPERESARARLLREPDRAYQLAARGAETYYVLSDAPGGEQERRFRSLNPEAVPLIDVAKPGNHSRFQLYRLPLQLGAGDTWLDPPAQVGSAVALGGFGLPQRTVAPGGVLRLALYWEARARPDRDYTVFTHLEGPNDRIWGQKDSQPMDGKRPTSRWRPGEAVPDVYEIPIQPDAPPGTYDLVVGMYDLATLQRLPVISSAGIPADRLLLARITVAPDTAE
jgi:hypothetical protein